MSPRYEERSDDDRGFAGAEGSEGVMAEGEDEGAMADAWLAELIKQEYPRFEAAAKKETEDLTRRRVDEIIGRLVYIHAILEVGDYKCPLCFQRLPHHEGCSIGEAWAISSKEAQVASRERARAAAATFSGAAELDWPSLPSDVEGEE